MEQTQSGDARHRRRTGNEIKAALRDLRIQLALLNHQIGGKLALKDVDLDCLDVLARSGPITPSALARSAGLHPATMTGILDRLERAGWVARERDPEDRRAVRVRALRERAGQIVGLYAGMNNALDQICAGYSEAELEVLADFLRRAADAGRQASQDLGEG